MNLWVSHKEWLASLSETSTNLRHGEGRGRGGGFKKFQSTCSREQTKTTQHNHS